MRYSYFGTTKDGNGKVICGATITVYLAGTSTLASVYTASSGGTAVNSVTSGADTSSTPGYFIFWIDRTLYTATQLFKIVISKSGFTSQTYDNIIESGGIAFDTIWPIGSIFIGAVSTNPGTLLNGGTWSAVHSGIWVSIGDIDLYIWQRTA